MLGRVILRNSEICEKPFENGSYNQDWTTQTHRRHRYTGNMRHITECIQYTLVNTTQVAINNRRSRDTDNIGHNIENIDKQNNNTKQNKIMQNTNTTIKPVVNLSAPWFFDISNIPALI